MRTNAAQDRLQFATGLRSGCGASVEEGVWKEAKEESLNSTVGMSARAAGTIVIHFFPVDHLGDTWIRTGIRITYSEPTADGKTRAIDFRQFSKEEHQTLADRASSKPASASVESIWVAFKLHEWRNFWAKPEVETARKQFADETARALAGSKPQSPDCVRNHAVAETVLFDGYCLQRLLSGHARKIALTLL
jgi:hypothetical protein